MFMILAAVVATALATPQLHRFQALALSPDGTSMAAVESDLPADTALPEGHGAVVVRSAAGVVVRRLDPCPACVYDGPTFSPDGRELAFVATDGLTATLMVATGDAVRRITTVHGVAQTPRWSPDGTAIALLAVDGATKATGAVEAGAPQVGEIGTTADEQRIAVVPAAGGTLRMVSPADTYVYEYDWLPSGTGFVATAAKGNGDDNWWVATLVAVDRASGDVRTIAAPAMQLDAPRVSPDGTTVAFIGGLMSDFGAVGGDLYTVPLAGGTPRNVTPGMPSTVMALVWRGRDPLVTRLTGDRTEIAAVRLGGATAQLTPLWSAAATLTAGDGGVAVSADGQRLATVAEDFEHPAEVHVGSIAGAALALAAVTHDNAALAPATTATSITWRSDGRDVQGWLLAPAAARTGTPAQHAYPMVVVVHGGPSAAVTPEYVWNGTIRALVDHGYYVFQPNPRGSYGQGEAFTRANVRDFGGGDLRDILAGVDAVARRGVVDPKRIGIFGHSYGGFMTMWAVTHTDRFKGAVAGAGIANWISYYGQNGIDQWMIPFFGASAYDDPAIYTKLSPLTTIRSAKTPTLIYVGERDLECPAAQSVEFWHALRERGVPTTLVIYPGEGHHLHQAASIHDRERRLLGWFDTTLK